MTLEQLLIIAVFVLVPLVNFLRRVWRSHIAGQASPESRPVGLPAPPRRQTPVSTVAVPRVEARPRPSSVTPTEVVGARRRPRLNLGSAREVRRALVLMAVLGPCRGQEPRLIRSGFPAEGRSARLRRANMR